jgi:hypothetical protein
LIGGYARQLRRIALYASPFGAASAILAFLVPTGWSTGGLFVLPWLAVCGVAGLAGLAELLESRSVHPAHLIPAAALGFLAVGAAWMLALRAGFAPLGYGPTLVELTSVHFHYAGFAATMMSALAVSALQVEAGWSRRYAAIAGVLVILGTPTTAAGFATGLRILTVIGPVLLATGVLTTAALTAFVIAPRLRGRARWLLTFSAAGVVVPMVLGVDYAASRLVPIPALDLKAMALLHGDLNALVFALLGFVGWTLI